MSHAKLLVTSAIGGLALTFGCSSLARSQATGTSSVGFSFIVPSNCTISSTIDGNLVGQQSPPTQLWGKGNDRGTVIVSCNQTGKRLELSINTASSKVHNGIPRARLSGGGNASGNFNFTPPSGYATINNGIIRNISTTTAGGGDIARIEGEINAPNGLLLQAAPDYKLVIDAIITP
jgi:hypothetical protein